MRRNKQILLLILIFALATLSVSVGMQLIMYQRNIEGVRGRLVELASSQARLIEAVARFDAEYSKGYQGGSRAATISQIVASHDAYPGFGRTGEFTMAQRSADSIEFVLSHRHYDLTTPTPVPWDAELAEPMRRALSGESGSLIGLDYRGKVVLAAYEPVAVLDLGIVAKIDLSEVRAPFWSGVALSGGLTILVVVLGAFLFVRVTTPFTERLAHSEMALRETSERLSLATTAARVGIWDWNVKDNVLVWDDSMHEIYGTRQEDFSGAYDAWTNALHPGDTERAERELQMALHGKKTFDTQFRIHRPDGDTASIRAIAKVHRDENDVPVRMVGTNWDTTQLNLERQRVQTQYEVTRLLAEAESLAKVSPRVLQIVCDIMDWDFGEMWEYDDEANLLRCAEVWHRTGMQLQAFVAKTRETTFAPGIGLPGRVLSSGEPEWVPDVTTDASFLRAHAAVAANLHAGVAIPVALGGRIVGVMVFLSSEIRQPDPESLTMMVILGGQLGQFIERKRAEASMKEAKATAEHASQAKSEFLSSMSHELRTPLNAIIGFSEVLNEQYFGDLNEKQVEYVADIEESGRHLLSLINDVLDLSKVEAGGMPLNVTRVNLSDLVGGSAAMIRERAMKHGIQLDLQAEEDIHLEADERRVRQVVYNLLSNAAKFTPDGGTITVKATLGDDEALVCVRDTGIGIEPDDQSKIFEEFYQASGGLKNKTPGTGLGLPLSRQLIEMHGGKLWVESEGKDKGSSFCFTLPLVQPERNTQETDGDEETDNGDPSKAHA